MTVAAKLTPKQFDQFFRDLHGYGPFPWQQMLLDRCAVEGWPDLIDLPTASGKTACIDVAVFFLALEAGRPTAERTAPRRIWFVVNRRIVVDEAYERAKKIACKLRDGATPVLRAVADQLRRVGGTDLPLAVARLRGGVPKQLAWSYHPTQPAVITSTVDQVGSRLMFRGYGVGANSRPVHAALAGNDSLIMLDEAHTANAFRQTLRWAGALREGWRDDGATAASPFVAVTMSATPPDEPGEDVTRFPNPETPGEHYRALDSPILRARYAASKLGRLVEVGKATAASDPLVEKAAGLSAELAASRLRVGVMVNRVATAAAIARTLRAAHPEQFTVVLLTGRMRPVDRDSLVARYSPFLRARDAEVPPDGRPIILVTTQCLEVGADFSFDALVTECASLDALRQRFGRLNRIGSPTGPAPAFMLIRANDRKDDDKLDDDKPLDPVYGNAMARTWNWLNAHPTTPAAGTGKKHVPATIDMGVEALGAKLAAVDLAPLLAPAPNAPILRPADLDLLCQTGPAPSLEPDVSLFLHGSQRGSPEAFVVFRQDLPNLDERNSREAADRIACETIEVMPPLTGERLPVPLWRLKDWLAGNATVADGSDVESERAPDETGDHPRANSVRRFVLYRGKSDIAIEADPRKLRPGATVILNVEAWPNELGTPGSMGQVDVYERAYATAHARDVTRVHPLILESTTLHPDVRAAIRDLFSDGQVPDRDAAQTILNEAGFADVRQRDITPYPDGKGFVVLLGAAEGAEVELDPFAFDDAALLDSDQSGEKSNEASLARHTERVTARAARFADHTLGENVAIAVRRAAELHDLGKADDRFQRCLNNGRRFGPPALLAKSRADMSPSRWASLQALTGLPDGFRHEMLSLQIALKLLPFDAPHRELILHLVAAHHGRARPFAPVVFDNDPPEVNLREPQAVSLPTAERLDAPPHRLDSGVANRFWRLTRAHGWWGLAHLEALLRLADWRASKEAGEGRSSR